MHALQRTTAGVELHGPPVLRLPRHANASELGAALREALEGYKPRVPNPATWTGVGEEFLKLAGFKSWRALQAPAKLCWVAEADASVTFTPLRNGGTRGDQKGFQPFGATDIVVLANGSDEQLGNALLGAIAASVAAV